MMSKKSLLKEIKQIFQNELNIKVNDKSKIYDFEAWDSLGNFNILLNSFVIDFLFSLFTSTYFAPQLSS